MLSGANQITQLAGPVLAGVLIGLFGASTVLVVDGCTYIFSFLVILIVVRAGKRVEAAAQQKGVFSGLKFLLGDSLLGPIMIAACAINFVAQGIVLGVQAIDYFRYDASGHVVGVPVRRLRRRRARRRDRRPAVDAEGAAAEARGGRDRRHASAALPALADDAVARCDVRSSPRSRSSRRSSMRR